MFAVVGSVFRNEKCCCIGYTATFFISKHYQYRPIWNWADYSCSIRSRSGPRYYIPTRQTIDCDHDEDVFQHDCPLVSIDAVAANKKHSFDDFGAKVTASGRGYWIASLAGCHFGHRPESRRHTRRRPFCRESCNPPKRSR